jgi:hypothetical protein
MMERGHDARSPEQPVIQLYSVHIGTGLSPEILSFVSSFVLVRHRCNIPCPNSNVGVQRIIRRVFQKRQPGVLLRRV